MNKQEFKSVSALAKHLGISRTTLYKRAESAGIKLTGQYSEQDIRVLSGVQKTVPDLDSYTEHNEQKNEHSEQSVDNHVEQLIELLTNQLNEKDNQLTTLTEQLNAKDTQLEALNKTLDQAQQLQLIAEQRLNEEHTQLIELKASVQQETKKGFWARLFDN